MPNLIGQSIGRYHVIEQIGQGGMATVFRAHDNRLERNVAIKVIRAGREIDDLFLKRFEREAKALAKLQHPNVVGIIDYGEHEGQPYLVMEYLPGGTLKQRLGRPVEYQEAAAILAPIARALQGAHQMNILHRDVKPGNILLTDAGQPMLTDFGIAKILQGSEETHDSLTSTGVGIGTPEYMAPEQWLGNVDARTDIYSLGVVFYEMVTGRRPYTADTPAAVLLKQATEPLPRPRSLVPDLPENVENVIFKALAKNPEERYQDMGSLASALEKLAQGVKVAVEKPSPPKKEAPVGGEKGSQWVIRILGGLVVILIVVVALFASGTIGGKKIPAVPALQETTPAKSSPMPKTTIQSGGSDSMLATMMAFPTSTPQSVSTANVDNNIPTPKPNNQPPPNVLLFLAGEQGDKSFSDSAVRGLKKAQQELGIQLEIVEAGYDSALWQPKLESAAKKDYDVMVLGSFSMTEYLQTLAPKYPDKKFIIYDVTLDYNACECKNVYSVTFKQNEGSYLAGLYAGLMTQSDIQRMNPDRTIGVVGGMDIPVINDFIVGYKQGANDAGLDPAKDVLVSYAGSFNDPAKARELALEMYQQGADVVYQVAGATGQGVFDAAQEVGAYAIGVDSDQAMVIESTNPQQATRILTSMMKNVDNVLYRAIKLHIEGTLPYGATETLGLAEGGVGLAYNKYYEEITPADIKTRLLQAEFDIKSGTIIVASGY